MFTSFCDSVKDLKKLTIKKKSQKIEQRRNLGNKDHNLQGLVKRLKECEKRE